MIDERPNQTVEQEVPWSPNPSCAHDCAMTQTYSLKLSKIETAGKHKLKILVRDFVRQYSRTKHRVRILPGDRDEGRIRDASLPAPRRQRQRNRRDDPRQPELAVNVMNGNLVYRETDIDVEGTALADLEVERYYNSHLPTGENTEWGDGWTLAQTPELQPIKTGGSSVPTKPSRRLERRASRATRPSDRSRRHEIRPGLSGDVHQEGGRRLRNDRRNRRIGGHDRLRRDRPGRGAAHRRLRQGRLRLRRRANSRKSRSATRQPSAPTHPNWRSPSRS